MPLSDEFHAESIFGYFLPQVLTNENLLYVREIRIKQRYKSCIKNVRILAQASTKISYQKMRDFISLEILAISNLTTQKIKARWNCH